ncbi:MAG: GYF domain-containing protein [Muribaculaceae bacterium]|nr:GYF domain-containing protein [Muribaculaceae bacterium]
MTQWYIIYDGQSKGPMSADELLNFGLTADSMVWTAGMPEWSRAGTCAELNALLATKAGGGFPHPEVTDASRSRVEDIDIDSPGAAPRQPNYDGYGNQPRGQEYGASGYGQRMADPNNPGNWADAGYGQYGQYGQYGRPQPGQWSGKSKVTAGLLAIFLGYLGVQYFYLDKVTAGIITIVLSIVTCGMWSVVTLIQGILMLTMTDRQFDDKYVYNSSTFPLF